jgi:hypothetical protein
MIDPTFDQARSLLIRWGYTPIESDVKASGEAVSPYAQTLNRRFPGSIWGKSNEELLLAPAEVPDFNRRTDELIDSLAHLYDLDQSDIRRIMLAEPGGTPTPPGVPPMQHLGEIHLEPQPLTDWGDREDHAPATIVMDKRGRDRLIAALIEGRDSIDVYGQSGGGYQLKFEVK